jgi:hypothetical protein
MEIISFRNRKFLSASKRFHCKCIPLIVRHDKTEMYDSGSFHNSLSSQRCVLDILCISRDLFESQRPYQKKEISSLMNK